MRATFKPMKTFIGNFLSLYQSIDRFCVAWCNKRPTWSLIALFFSSFFCFLRAAWIYLLEWVKDWMNEWVDKEARRELYLVAYSLYLLAGLELASYYLDSGGILAKNRSNLKKREKERERERFKRNSWLLNCCRQENNHHHNHQVFQTDDHFHHEKVVNWF